MNHEINLTGYTASCNAADNMLCLGTAGSYGLEKLHVTADAAWDGLTITATFTNSGSTTVAVTDGAVDVPPEATRMPTRDRVRYGQIAFKGADADGSIRLISTPVYYKVQASSATDGENTIAPTPDQYAQFVAEVTAEADRAEAAANRAESAGSTVTPEQIAEAVNSYLDENPVQPTAIDATLTQSGQAADAAAVGDRLSALSEEIAAIPSGKDGADGKSAYQYAVDGGYTGTETEFAEKMAQEKFANPNALTFTGAVTGSYDGSAPVSVEIPSGGSGSSAIELVYKHICDGTYVSVTDDLPLENGKVYLTRLTLPIGSEKLTVRCLIGGQGNTYTGAVAANVVDQHAVTKKQAHSLMMKTATEIVGISYFGGNVPDSTGYNLGQPTSSKLGDKIYFYSTASGINLPDGTTVEVYRMN